MKDTDIEKSDESPTYTPPNILWRQALNDLDNKRFDIALNKFDRIINSENASKKLIINSYFYKAKILYELTKYKDSIKVFDEIIERINVLDEIERNPNYIETYRDKGFIYKKIKKYDEAIDAFNKALELDPGNSDILSHMNEAIGLKAMDIEKYDDAITAFKKALEVDPDNDCLLSYIKNAEEEKQKLKIVNKIEELNDSIK